MMRLQPNQDDSRLSELFGQMKDLTRIQLVRTLAGGEATVPDLLDSAGCSQPTLSNHLRSMRMCEIVTVRRDGARAIYRLTETGEKLAGVMGSL